MLKRGYQIPPCEDIMKGLELTIAEGTLVPNRSFRVACSHEKTQPLPSSEGAAPSYWRMEG